MGFAQGRILLVCGLVVIAAASRLVPHPPNLTSIGALEVFERSFPALREPAVQS